MEMIKVQSIKDALLDFCDDQAYGKVPYKKIQEVIDSSFGIMKTYPKTELPVAAINSYMVYTNCKEHTELFDESAYADSVICDGVILGTFPIDPITKSADHSFIRGYDIVYDPYMDEIRLLYIIASQCGNDLSVYRVDTKTFEDFSFYGFILGLVAQMCRKLI